MRRSNPRLNWDRLLDGNIYVLDLHEIKWSGSINDLRSKAHYEADRRRGIATTRKLDFATLEVKGEGMPRPPRDPCTCGAPVWDFHIITCRSLGANAATQIGGATCGVALVLRTNARTVGASLTAPSTGVVHTVG